MPYRIHLLLGFALVSLCLTLWRLSGIPGRDIVAALISFSCFALALYARDIYRAIQDARRGKKK